MRSGRQRSTDWRPTPGTTRHFSGVARDPAPATEALNAERQQRVTPAAEGARCRSAALREQASPHLAEFPLTEFPLTLFDRPRIESSVPTLQAGGSCSATRTARTTIGWWRSKLSTTLETSPYEPKQSRQRAPERRSDEARERRMPGPEDVCRHCGMARASLHR
jgi:hypothetical protein